MATGVASFLEDALNSKSANKHLRRANMLVMGKQVKNGLPGSWWFVNVDGRLPIFVLRMRYCERDASLRKKAPVPSR